MPIDLEYLLSASNHGLFHYSSFGATDYSDSPYGRSSYFPQNHCVPRSAKHQDQFHKKTGSSVFANGTSYSLKGNVDTRKELHCARKKKVSFADDKGFKLVEVREIPGGAPKWADDVITLLIGSRKRSVIKEKRWKIAFQHPPWPDDELIDTLDKNMVALEHLSVNEGVDDFLTGIIKVKNLAFEKNVFIRVTFDRWLSYVDIPCTYMKPNKERTGATMYDTFYFNTKILPVASRYEVIEFCICFQCDGKEYWDNNCGINYRLIVEYVKSNLPDLNQEHTPTICSKKSHSFVTDYSDEIFMQKDLMNGDYCW